MSDEITYREPTQEQLDLMRKFSDICSHGIQLIMQCEANPALMNSSTRIQEAMMWFHSYIINGGKLITESKH
jgi:hypothetical protein